MKGVAVENGASEAVGGGSNLSHRIETLLRERILKWSYPPGLHLGEIALCAEFKASRIPVREALRILAEQGLVDKVPNQGCFVKQPDVEETQQLYDMRLALELFVVESLASAGSLSLDWLKEQRVYWEPLLAVKADDTADRDALVDADTLFHFGLAEALGNQPICNALRDINARLRFVRLAAITNAHRIQETAGEHLAVLDALEKRDAEAARRSLRQNINHSRNKVELAIGRALMSVHKKRG
ncbi:GntR family transcriptional regulator [Pelagicoccus sp. SDUM812002]|uniref:GntR family transcriptional regulator n=1 Tax=Pelagicoccus sp. SDUM812002 TaxID=3041266 RepID=UPI00280C52A6|nr:GntR family transcriptional regulator [Pelagicoccus sp. SDUM812002]MDQ8187977.1 GntR family transcriptional regulator [Pelagicoccus sp. SDUM812002]